MNSISIHGRLTRDVELKTTQSGKSVASFSVAVDRAYKAADGSKQTDFFNCTAWGGAADVIAQYFSKGSEIALTGEMHNDRYKDKDGNDRDWWSINVSTFDFCGSKSDKQSQGVKNGPPVSSNAPSLEDYEEIDDSDVPF